MNLMKTKYVKREIFDFQLPSVAQERQSVLKFLIMTLVIDLIGRRRDEVIKNVI